METVEQPSATTPAPPPVPFTRIVKHYGLPVRRSGTWTMTECPRHYDARMNLRWKEGHRTAVCFTCSWRPDALELVQVLDRCDRETALTALARMTPR